MVIEKPDLNILTWGDTCSPSDIIEPDDQVRNDGWAFKQTVPYQWFNWILASIANWLKWCVDNIDILNNRLDNLKFDPELGIDDLHRPYVKPIASGAELNLYIKSNTDTNIAYKIWHQNNDGVESGLDADLLDGKHGSEYALLNGDKEENFQVKDPFDDYDAVNKRYFESHQVNGAAYVVESGKTTNGYADYVSKVDNTMVNILAGSTNSNMSLIYSDGSKGVLTENQTIEVNSGDGAYTLLKEKTNPFINAVKLGYSSEDLILPPMTSNSQDGFELSFYYTAPGVFMPNKEVYKLFDRNDTTDVGMGVGDGNSPDYQAPAYDGYTNWGRAWTIIKCPSPTSLTRMQVYSSNNNQPGRPYCMHVYGSNDTTNGVDGNWTTLGVILEPSYGMVYSPTAELDSSSTYTYFKLDPDVSTYGGYSGYPTSINEIKLWGTRLFTGGSITESLVTPVDPLAGDYWLDISTKPYRGYKYNGSAWISTDFVKLTKIQKTSGVIGTPKSFWFNDTALVKLTTTSGTQYSIENLFNTDLITVQIKENGIIKNLLPSISKNSINWTSSFTGSTELVVRRAF